MRILVCDGLEKTGVEILRAAAGVSVDEQPSVTRESAGAAVEPRLHWPERIGKWVWWMAAATALVVAVVGYDTFIGRPPPALNDQMEPAQSSPPSHSIRLAAPPETGMTARFLETRHAACTLQETEFSIGGAVCVPRIIERTLLNKN